MVMKILAYNVVCKVAHNDFNANTYTTSITFFKIVIYCVKSIHLNIVTAANMFNRYATLILLNL